MCQRTAGWKKAAFLTLQTSENGSKKETEKIPNVLLPSNNCPNIFSPEIITQTHTYQH